MSRTLPALIDVEALAQRLDDPHLRLFDTTVRLLRPAGGGPYVVASGHDHYRREHIPGAAFADIPAELSDPDARFPFTLPRAGRFAAGAGQLGISDGTYVVAYSQESPMWATRLWWLLRLFGHDAVSVLDGGLGAWRRAGLPLDRGEVVYAPAVFHARQRPELLATRADVERLASSGEARLINALRPATFRGEGVSSYSRPGRIPGSANVPWAELLDRDSGRFLPSERLRQRLGVAGALGPEPVVAYCGGGISATVAVFALALLGRDDVRLYDGSLAEWTSDPALPVELG